MAGVSIALRPVLIYIPSKENDILLSNKILFKIIFYINK
jgi:hypothetical protein